MLTRIRKGLAKKVAFASMAAGVLAGCTALDERGQPIGTPARAYQPVQQTQQAVATEDLELLGDIADVASIFVPNLRHALLLRTAGASARNRAVVQGQQDAAQTIVQGAQIPQQDVRPRTIRLAGLPYALSVDYEQQTLTSKGLMARLVGVPPGAEEFTCVACNYLHDDNGNGRIDFPYECNGINDTFTTNQMITLSCFSNISRPGNSVEIKNSRGESTFQFSIPESSGGPRVVYKPGELAPDRYTVSWYQNGRFLVKVPFTVIEK